MGRAAHRCVAKVHAAHLDGEEAARHAGQRGNGHQRAKRAPALLRREHVRHQRLAGWKHQRQAHPSACCPRRRLAATPIISRGTRTVPSLSAHSPACALPGALSITSQQINTQTVSESCKCGLPDVILSSALPASDIHQSSKRAVLQAGRRSAATAHCSAQCQRAAPRRSAGQSRTAA